MNRTAEKLPFYLLILTSLALIVITIIAYLPSLNYDFQFDDLASITKHFNIRHYNLKSLFFSGTRWISYWLNSIYYSLGKFNPWYYRAGNLIIHITNGLLLFYFLLLAFGRSTSSFLQTHCHKIASLTSLLFLLHPVQTQTVSYVIQGQLEGLAALSTLAMIIIFIKAFDTNRWSVCIAWIFCLSCIAFLSSGTKEIAIISPLLLLLVDWFFVSRGCRKKFLKNMPCHLLITGIVFGCYLWLLKKDFFFNIFGLRVTAKNNIGNMITQSPTEVITPGHFFISQFKVILHYLLIFLWPFNISVEYDWKLAEQFFAYDCILPLIILLAISIYVMTVLYKKPTHIIGFCALWFLFCMAPRSSIVPSPELLVDYKTYLASCSWLCLIALGFIIVWNYCASTVKIHRFAGHGSIVIFSLFLCYFTMQRNTVWRSGLEFWENVIQNAPNKARAYNNYGVELSQKLNQYAESIPYFLKSINMDKLYPDPCNNVAVAYAAIGKIDDAIDALKKGLRINPYYPEGYNNLASFLIMKKDYKQAKQALETALMLRPYYGKALLNMGRIYLDEQEVEKAWECFRKCCLEADLDNEIGFNAYGRVSVMLKKYDEAIFAYKKVIEMTPNDHEAYFNLGNVYFMNGALEQSCTIYQKAYEKNPNDVRLWYNLGEVYFCLNNYQEALYYFEKVRSIPQPYPTQLYLRMATCYEKTNRAGAARQLLTGLLEKPLPNFDKEQIKNQLVRLHA